ANDLHHLCANLLQVHTKAFEDARSDAFALTDKAEQEVLCSNVMVVQPSGLIDRKLNDLLGARSETDFPNDNRLATANDELNGRANLGELDAHVAQDTRCDAIVLANQTQQQMLGSNVVVIEPLRFFLSQGED